jgi:hypothetical protein
MENIFSSVWRTTAESSTISTCIFLFMVAFFHDFLPEGVGVVHGAQALQEDLSRMRIKKELSPLDAADVLCRQFEAFMEQRCVGHGDILSADGDEARPRTFSREHVGPAETFDLDFPSRYFVPVEDRRHLPDRVIHVFEPVLASLRTGIDALVPSAAVRQKAMTDGGKPPSAVEHRHGQTGPEHGHDKLRFRDNMQFPRLEKHHREFFPIVDHKTFL